MKRATSSKSGWNCGYCGQVPLRQVPDPRELDPPLIGAQPVLFQPLLVVGKGLRNDHVGRCQARGCVPAVEFSRGPDVGNPRCAHGASLSALGRVATFRAVVARGCGNSTIHSPGGALAFGGVGRGQACVSSAIGGRGRRTGVLAPEGIGVTGLLNCLTVVNKGLSEGYATPTVA